MTLDLTVFTAFLVINSAVIGISIYESVAHWNLRRTVYKHELHLANLSRSVERITEHLRGSHEP